jgi:hypothetical protein
MWTVKELIRNGLIIGIRKVDVNGLRWRCPWLKCNEGLQDLSK